MGVKVFSFLLLAALAVSGSVAQNTTTNSTTNSTSTTVTTVDLTKTYVITPTISPGVPATVSLPSGTYSGIIAVPLSSGGTINIVGLSTNGGTLTVSIPSNATAYTQAVSTGNKPLSDVLQFDMAGGSVTNATLVFNITSLVKQNPSLVTDGTVAIGWWTFDTTANAWVLPTGGKQLGAQKLDDGSWIVVAVIKHFSAWTVQSYKAQNQASSAFGRSAEVLVTAAAGLAAMTMAL